MVDIVGKPARGVKSGVGIVSTPFSLLGDVIINVPDPSDPQSYGWVPNRFEHPDNPSAATIPTS